MVLSRRRAEVRAFDEALAALLENPSSAQLTCVEGTLLDAAIIRSPVLDAPCLGYSVELDEWIPLDMTDGHWTSRGVESACADLALRVAMDTVHLPDAAALTLEGFAPACDIDSLAEGLSASPRQVALRLFPQLGAFPRSRLRIREWHLLAGMNGAPSRLHCVENMDITKMMAVGLAGTRRTAEIVPNAHRPATIQQVRARARSFRRCQPMPASTAEKAPLTSAPQVQRYQGG